MKDSREKDQLNRRQLIIKSMKIGGAAYVVPMVLSSATPAMAQVTNPLCVGATCDTFIGCSTNPDCVCVTLANGAGFCVPGSTSCGGLSQCGAGNTCPAGFVCALNTCCGIPVCLSNGLGAACAAGTAQTPSARVPGTIAGR